MPDQQKRNHNFLKTYHERKNQGLCPQCGNKAVSGKLYCAVHAEAARKRNQARRERLKAKGLCVTCGQVLAKYRCQKCRETYERPPKNPRGPQITPAPEPEKPVLASSWKPTAAAEAFLRDLERRVA